MSCLEPVGPDYVALGIQERAWTLRGDTCSPGPGPCGGNHRPDARTRSRTTPCASSTAAAGRLLLEVDRAVAETRFYPHRIFAVGNHRYEAQMHAFDGKRSGIHADLVDSARPLTRPLLTVQLSHPDLIEGPHQVVRGKLAFGLSAYEATALETASGVLQADGRITTYAPVSSQYRTRVRIISFRGRLPRNTHAHLAHSMGSTTAAHLLAGAEDVVVIPLSESFLSESASPTSKRFHEDHPTSVAVLDRFVQGMGVVNSLDAPFVDELMSWVRAILAGCSSC